MRGQQGGLHLQRQCVLQALGHTQHLQLTFHGEPIAALDLHGHGALAHHLFQPKAGLPVQGLFIHLAQLAGAVQDAATACSDLLIAEPLDLVHELFFAWRCEHRVGVRVAPSGQHVAAGGVDHRYIAADRGKRIHAPKFGDAAVLDQQPTIAYLRQTGHFRTARNGYTRCMGAHQCLRVLDQQSVHCVGRADMVRPAAKKARKRGSRPVVAVTTG